MFLKIHVISLMNVLIFLNGIKVHSSWKCESTIGSSLVPEEGVIGETDTFPWLGLLKIYLYDIDTVREAVTGIVLVRENYAIVNADDVARIPKKIFKKSSTAMFIPQDRQPWYCSLRDYLTHPEYKYPTLTTIALVDLDMGGHNMFPILPLCWSHTTKNDHLNKLYSVGFTDEMGPLEKFLFKMHSIDLDVCNNFYEKSNLTDKKWIPTYYKCATAKTHINNCVWDNGMALISNHKGYWVLIGLGVRGPGCAAPARFIDLTSYYGWIEESTNKDVAAIESRRSAFNEGFGKSLRINTQDSDDILTSWSYTFDTESHQYDYFTIDRIEKDAIEIKPITEGSRGNCSGLQSDVVYRDVVEIDGPRVRPVTRITAVYKVSIYDLYFYNFTCASFKLKSGFKPEAKLYYRTVIENKEGSSKAKFGETPDEILKHYYIKNETAENIEKEKKKLNPDYIMNPPYMRPAPITDTFDYINRTNLNVLLKFVYYSKASFEVKIYGKRKFSSKPRTTTIKKSTYPDY